LAFSKLPLLLISASFLKLALFSSSVKIFDAADMCGLAVLVVLCYVHLSDYIVERVTIRTTAIVGNGNILPAYRICKWNFGKLNEVVGACACIKSNVCWGVRLILAVVDVEAHCAELNAVWEVNR
jgi:hypothetical protein